MLGVVAIPSLIFTFLTLLVSESPRWMALRRNDLTGAKAVLQEIDPDAADATLAAILASKQRAEASPEKTFFSAHYRWPIALAFLLAFFNQLSGINAIIYYAPRIFQMTGLSKSSALLSTAGIGLVNLIFTMVGLSLIDRFGRRVLMYIGSIGYIVSLGLIALAFYRNSFAGVTILVLAFIALHAVGQGAVNWVFHRQIFSKRGARRWAIVRQLHALDLRSHHRECISTVFRAIWRSAHFCLFLRDDGLAAAVCDVHDAGNEGRGPGGHGHKARALKCFPKGSG